MADSAGTLVKDSVHGKVLVLTIWASHIREAEVSYSLRDELVAITDRVGLPNIVIDFSRVEFMGSVGFLALMTLRRHAADARILVCGLSERMQAIFVSCRLLSADRAAKAIFEQADSLEQALEILNG